MQILTKENAKYVKKIRNIQFPEWGIKKFNYNSECLNDGRFCSSCGIGADSAVLFESEYKYWEVIEYVSNYSDLQEEFYQENNRR